MSKVAKFVAALTLTASLATLAATGADAQNRRNRGGEAAAPAAPPVSRTFAAAFGPVDTAIRAQGWDAANAALPALVAAASSPYEKYLAGQTEFRIASGMTDAARQLRAVNLMIDSAGVQGADLNRLYVAAAQLAYNQNDYAQAAARLERATALGVTSDNVPTLYVDALIRSGQLNQAVAAARTMIATAQTSGQAAPENVYSLLARALQEADRDAELLEILTQRYAAYPTEFNVRSAGLTFLRVRPDNRDDAIDTIRLFIAAGAMNDRRYYLEHVGNLADAALPNEAMTVLRAGRAAHIIPTPDRAFDEIAQIQQDRLADDRASLATSERGALAAVEARRSVLVGDAYLSYQNYAKAEALYTAALAKTGADAALINTRIGITRIGAGDFAGGLAALGTVQGPRAPLAQLWATYARSRIAAATAAAAPAAPAAV
ncbi:MAG: hypothetical protein ACKOUM_09365, partial [Sphingopyxis sp.]